MDPRGARELAKRIADEERRRAHGTAESRPDIAPAGAGAASPDSVTGDALVAIERLEAEVASLRSELAARDDAIARLRTDLGELRASMAVQPGSGEAPQDETAGHVVFVAQASSYRLLARDGPVPTVGSEIVLTGETGGSHRVCKVGRSPLPGDVRRCAFLERVR